MRWHRPDEPEWVQHDRRTRAEIEYDKRMRLRVDAIINDSKALRREMARIKKGLRT